MSGLAPGARLRRKDEESDVSTLKSPTPWAGAMLAGWLGFAGVALAADIDRVVFDASGPADSVTTQPAHPGQGATRTATAIGVEGIGSALAADALDELRGGDASTGNGSSVDNDIRVGGQVDDNDIENVVTGDNIINGGSFANAAGLTTVIQNTGAGVLIQNATIVNIQFADPGP